MKENIERRFEHRGVAVEIHYDPDPISPQDDDYTTELFLTGEHPQFYVHPPGKHSHMGTNETIERLQSSHWVFVLEAYIHGGVSLALADSDRAKRFPDRQWDVSRVGCVFVSKENWRLSKKARAAAEAYVDAFNQYLSGRAYGYVVDPDGDQDSCWGFYDLEECIEESISIADSVADAREDMAKKTAECVP